MKIFIKVRYINHPMRISAATATPIIWSAGSTGTVAAHRFRAKLWSLGGGCTGAVTG